MKKVQTIKIAKTFLIAQRLKKEYSKIDTAKNYNKTYKKIKKEINSYSDKKLWSLIKDKNRVKRYKNSTWHLKKINITHAGVWPRMGNLKDSLIKKDVKWSSNKIHHNISKISKKELNHLLRIIPLSKYLDKHLPIICVQGGIIRQRFPYKKQRYDIDDGCHRAICLAFLGKTFVNAYVGLKNK